MALLWPAISTESHTQVMMANERVNEDEAEAILSNLKMEGRSSDLSDPAGSWWVIGEVKWDNVGITV